MENHNLDLAIKNWYKYRINPIVKDINNKLYKTKESENNLMVGLWWAIFLRNSMSLFQIMLMTNYLNQTAMTMRLLMEFAADTAFVSKYPQNINDFIKKHEKYLEENKSRKLLYKSLGMEAKDYQLHEYNNGEKGKSITTSRRIELAFGKKGYESYIFLNCFAHLNYLSAIWDANCGITKDEDDFNNRMQIISLYPIIFKTMVVSIGKLCESNELEKETGAKIKEALNELIANHSLDEIHL